MTNPGDSDEWWKQYGGQGVSPDSGAQGSMPQYPTSDQPGYPSAPQQPEQQYGQQQQYGQPQSQPQYGQQSYSSYPQQPAAQPYGQPQPNYGNQGYAGGAYQPYGYPQNQGTNGLAIASLIVSLVGLCTCLGSIVGIVLGIMALNQIKERGGQEGRNMALAGIWIGAGGIALTIVYFVIVLVGSA
ncbi:DUF4190 domain-containing protein [Nocardia harenae]|uniref:DUF4190 domain-containing protein n=1 Tax=Nocardia harenae TaxID=358707 RepID=UPI00083278C8|nr:DUF4190 domain-containing protein [Nocardia harenae]